ncbi:hypothetical protein TNCV_3044241 [Trichonephila clavipes]|nr:hypothetical protein TNCV_3044241 [Trichonephila clavipes]
MLQNLPEDPQLKRKGWNPIKDGEKKVACLEWAAESDRKTSLRGQAVECPSSLDETDARKTTATQQPQASRSTTLNRIGNILFYVRQSMLEAVQAKVGLVSVV